MTKFLFPIVSSFFQVAAKCHLAEKSSKFKSQVSIYTISPSNKDNKKYHIFFIGREICSLTFRQKHIFFFCVKIGCWRKNSDVLKEVTEGWRKLHNRTSRLTLLYKYCVNHMMV